MSCVVKKWAGNTADLFIDFSRYIQSSEVQAACATHKGDFSRQRKFPWYDLLFYLIFRSEKTANSELTRYFADMGRSSERISKQALFKAAKKLNPEVFSGLTLKFSELFYRSHLVKKYRGYLLLAEDGTTLEIPKSRQSLDEFGYVENQSTVKGDSYIHKASSHSAILYDVTNGIAVDFLMRPFRYSEIPLAIEHLNRTDAILHGQKIVYLADRYYDSAELFRLLELRGYRYCVRAKSNMFKHQVAAMKSDDEWITVVLNGQWLKRLKYEQARESFMKDPVLHVRVVKYRHRSVDRATGEIKETELTYFTDLDEKEFSSEEIAALYAKRWDIEVSYKSLKSGYELERYFSNDCSIARCAVCAKVLYHNLVGVIRKEMDRSLSKKRSHTEYAYAVNITQLNDHIRKNNLLYMIFHRRRSGIIGLINDVIGLADKIKVPVRPDRHEMRWGKVISVSKPTRFRIDGRNWPNTIRFKHRLMTVRP